MAFHCSAKDTPIISWAPAKVAAATVEVRSVLLGFMLLSKFNERAEGKCRHRKEAWRPDQGANRRDAQQVDRYMQQPRDDRHQGCVVRPRVREAQRNRQQSQRQDHAGTFFQVVDRLVDAVAERALDYNLPSDSMTCQADHRACRCTRSIG